MNRFLLFGLFILFFVSTLAAQKERKLTDQETKNLMNLPSSRQMEEDKIDSILLKYLVVNNIDETASVLRDMNENDFLKLVHEIDSTFNVNIPFNEYENLRSGSPFEIYKIVFKYDNFSKRKVDYLPYSYGGLKIGEVLENDTIKQGIYFCKDTEKMIIPPKYQKIEAVDNGHNPVEYFIVKDFKGQYGLHTAEGEKIFDCIYQEIITGFNPNEFIVQNDDVYSLVDRNGILLSKFPNHKLQSFVYENYGYYFFKNESTKGIVNLNEEVVLELSTQHIFYPKHSGGYPLTIVHHKDSLLQFYDANFKLVNEIDSAQIVLWKLIQFIKSKSQSFLF